MRWKSNFSVAVPADCSLFPAGTIKVTCWKTSTSSTATMMQQLIGGAVSCAVKHHPGSVDYKGSTKGISSKTFFVLKGESALFVARLAETYVYIDHILSSFLWDRPYSANVSGSYPFSIHDSLVKESKVLGLRMAANQLWPPPCIMKGTGLHGMVVSARLQ